MVGVTRIELVTPTMSKLRPPSVTFILGESDIGFSFLYQWLAV
jgi:hypothetical protein